MLIFFFFLMWALTEDQVKTKLRESSSKFSRYTKFRYNIANAIFAIALRNFGEFFYWCIICDIFVGQPQRNCPEMSVFRLKKRLFLAANISRSKAGFDPRPAPKENINLLLAVYSSFK
jgi:hypothetical protein